jgi:RNA polymerase sigma-70 factor, ECF subfamily
METTQRYMDGSEYAVAENQAAEAFGQVSSNARLSLYRRAYRLLGNSADAEDAVQDALLAAYTHLGQFKGQARMSTWMTAIVHNCARMQLRSRRRHVHIPIDEQPRETDELTLAERLPDRGPSPEEECSSTELHAHLTRFHRRLSPTLRRAFQLRDIEGLSVRETAKILGVPNGTVKAQSARARKKLEESMQRSLKRRMPNPIGRALRGAA